MTFPTAKYGDPVTTMWCKQSKDIRGIRKDCMNDKHCLGNARSQCDNDPNCFGVSWLPKRINRFTDLKLCLSKEMVPTTDGWRTMMKSEGNQKRSF